MLNPGAPGTGFSAYGQQGANAQFPIGALQNNLQSGLPNVRGGLGGLQASAQGLQAQANAQRGFAGAQAQLQNNNLQQQLNNQFQARQGALGNANLANGVLGANAAAAVAAGVRAGGALGNMNPAQAPGLTARLPGVGDRGNIGLANLGAGAVGQQNLGMQNYQLAALQQANQAALQQGMNRLAGGINMAQNNLLQQQANNARLQNMGGALGVNLMQQQGMPATNTQGQDLLQMLAGRKQAGQSVLGGTAQGVLGAQADAFALMKQQQAQQQQQQQQGRAGPQGGAGPGQDVFNVANEDFPALPGAMAPRGGDDGGRSAYGALQSGAAAALGRGTYMLGGGGDQYGAGVLGDVARAQAAEYNDAAHAMLRYQQQQQAAAGAAAAQRPGGAKPGGLMGMVPGPLGGDVAGGKAAGGMERMGPPPDKWGLLAIMPLLKMTDQDATTLELGINLTTLGLDLTSPSSLHKALVTPLSAHPIKVEPEFDLPLCYKHIPQRLHPGYLSKFKDETLFYIFYSMPGDEAQLVAADELSTRTWVFHKRLRMWMMPTPALPPPQKSARSERGSYVVFNPTVWEFEPKQDLEVMYDDWETPPRLQRPGPQQQRPPTGPAGAGGAPQQQPQQQPGPGGAPGQPGMQAVGSGAPARA